MSYVITRLMGGLGNQLFQYAAGHALSTRLNVPLLVDRTFLDHRPSGMTWTPRELELDALRVPLTFATARDVRRLRRPLDDRTYQRASRVLPFLFADHTFRERRKGYDPHIEQVNAPIYLDGFWQNEGYFTSIADVLRNELFVPRDPPSQRNTELRDAMRSTKSASLHVRRGDYVSNSEASRFHGVCSVDYYVGSAELLARDQGVDHFFVFSDDPEWVRANIHLPQATTYVDHNTGRDGHWDLWLMKHCAHHIIANSSFSWWGAWLDPSPHKQVIAPARWFQGEDLPSSAILPPTWIAR